jgi:hypothetical protein
MNCPFSIEIWFQFQMLCAFGFHGRKPLDASSMVDWWHIQPQKHHQVPSLPLRFGSAADMLEILE